MTLCRGSAARGRIGKVAGQGRRSVRAVSMATEDQEKKKTQEASVKAITTRQRRGQCVCVCFNSCQRDSG